MGKYGKMWEIPLMESVEWENHREIWVKLGNPF
jgi:hypothetical protein